VIVGDEKCDWNADTFKNINISLSGCSLDFDDRSFNLPITHEEVDGINNFIAKSTEILRLVKRLNTDCVTLDQIERPGSNVISDSDSEGIIDPPIDPPFSKSDWKSITDFFFETGGLKELFQVAKAQSFYNHAGKEFVSSFKKFCSILVPGRKAYVNHSTCSSGEFQPGSTSYIESVIRSTPSSNRSTPTCDGVTSKPREVVCERFTDVAYWDEKKKIYPIITEVKSADKQASETQLTEQMFGLFRKHQKVMLGLAIKPNFVGIKIMTKEKGSLEIHSLESDLSLLKHTVLRKIGKLIMAFMYYIDC
jgi:hypothetical protein